MSKAYEFGASLGRKGGQPWVRFSTWLLLGLSPEGAADVVGYAASGTGGGVVTAAVAVDALEAYESDLTGSASVEVPVSTLADIGDERVREWTGLDPVAGHA